METSKDLSGQKLFTSKRPKCIPEVDDKKKKTFIKMVTYKQSVMESIYISIDIQTCQQGCIVNYRGKKLTDELLQHLNLKK